MDFVHNELTIAIVDAAASLVARAGQRPSRSLLERRPLQTCGGSIQFSLSDTFEGDRIQQPLGKYFLPRHAPARQLYATLAPNILR